MVSVSLSGSQESEITSPNSDLTLGCEALDGSGNQLCVNVELEKAMAIHSSTLVWKIPWMEEPGRLQSMGSLRVGHD